ncbi:MAG: alkaline phosphatase family protein [Planctomycetota bacterium]|jgi:predicted AlkP superfamily phosphohydrolase/phosphomutase
MNKRILTTAALALAGLALSCSGEPSSEKRVVAFGVDGLDPEMLQERMDRGLMPNFQRLIEERGATFSSLQTSWPPQSPVAWSNFITGTNPGKHGLYDFIHLDRESYGIASSMVETEPVGLSMTLFGYEIPLTGGAAESTRQFPAFWDGLHDAGVPVYVHRMPASYPLTESEAVVYPDMGTPDMMGALAGISYLWSDDPAKESKVTDSTRLEKVRVNRRDDRLWKLPTRMYGPPDMKSTKALRKRQAEATAAGDFAEANRLAAEVEALNEVFTPIDIYVDRSGVRPQLAVDVEGEYAVAEEGGWSNWVPIEFGVLGGLAPVAGYTRFRFISAEPFEVYAVPVQPDPWAPAAPISMPEDAAADLADAIGPYLVQGFPDAYKSYKSELLDTAGFVDQSDQVFAERLRMLDYGLDQLDDTGGLLFLYTGSLDLRCHMLWHTSDPDHPHQEEEGMYDGRPYSEQIDRVYEQVDGMLGRLMARIEEMEADGKGPVELLILSDHGFAPFRRKMHVNDWLMQEGYLVLKEGETSAATLALDLDEDGEPVPGSGRVDWSRTRAFSVGFNGVILNRAGREPEGIVTDAEAGPLLAEIQGKLLALEDGGVPVMTRVLPATEVFDGPMVTVAPDLQLGFNVGYGCSDESAAGEVVGEGEWLVDNDSRWSGSHLMDPELVRGTLVVRSGATLSKDPTLEDLTATLFALFDVEAPEGTDGMPLY